MPKLDDQTLGVLDQINEAAGSAAAPAVPPAPTPEQPAVVQENAPMQHLGTYAGNQIDSAVIFAGEGYNISQRTIMTPDYARKLAQAARFYKEVVEGKRTLLQLHEAMMSSEFSVLLGDTMDRVLLAKYAVYVPSYRQFLRGRTVRDFRTVGSVRRNTGGRLSAVAQGTHYRGEGVTEESYTYAVGKYGKTYELTWEMMVNDDLDAFTSLPDDMASDAIQTEMYLASALYVANTTLFATNHSHAGATYSNKGTAALSVAALEAAFNAMLKYPGDSDKPLANTPVYLVVPPALRLTAMRILGSMNIQYAGGDATTGIVAVAYPASNVMQGMLTIIVDPYIPILDPTNGHTSWYLFCDTGVGFAAEYAFLRGYEQPQVFRRSPNAIRLGGGGTEEVDYDTDTIGYKVRHIFGGSHANAAGGWRFAFWSDGTA